MFLEAGNFEKELHKCMGETIEVLPKPSEDQP